MVGVVGAICTNVIFVTPPTVIPATSSSISSNTSERSEACPGTATTSTVSCSQPSVNIKIFSDSCSVLTGGSTKCGKLPYSHIFLLTFSYVSADRVDNGDPCKTYVCHECNRTFKHPGNFKQHMASHNKQLVSAPNFPMENLLRRPMPGLVKMVNGNSSNENVVKTEEKEWDCPECSDKFPRGVDLQSHMKTVHNIEMVLQAGPEGERAVSPPRLASEDGLKALALAAGADRLAQFSCDVPVRLSSSR